MENTSKPVIGVAQVLQMLKKGKTREEIRVHYGINKTNLVLLFKHEDLIGKKTIKQKEPAFTIVDDESAFTIVDDESVVVAPADAVEEIEVVVTEVKAEETITEVKAEETITDNNTYANDVQGTADADKKEEQEETEKPEAKSTWV
jgi:hypothetical protein